MHEVAYDVFLQRYPDIRIARKVLLDFLLEVHSHSLNEKTLPLIKWFAYVCSLSHSFPVATRMPIIQEGKGGDGGMLKLLAGKSSTERDATTNLPTLVVQDPGNYTPTAKECREMFMDTLASARKYSLTRTTYKQHIQEKMVEDKEMGRPVIRYPDYDDLCLDIGEGCRFLLLRDVHSVLCDIQHYFPFHVVSGAAGQSDSVLTENSIKVLYRGVPIDEAIAQVMTLWVSQRYVVVLLCLFLSFYLSIFLSTSLSINLSLFLSFSHSPHVLHVSSSLLYIYISNLSLLHSFHLH